MINIPKSHPRYQSLITREKLVDGYRKGIVVEEGLIAHGRGETFDYLIGEKTIEFAYQAIDIASMYLITAKNPVISVNGNTAVLCGEEIIKLSDVSNAKIEVNLFYRTEERVDKIIQYLESLGGRDILGRNPDARINGLEHPRGLCEHDGIYSADTILLALEDGDRTEALRRMGKTIIAIDLNPLSRTAQQATVTIVDNVTRAIPLLTKRVKEIKKTKHKNLVFNNRMNLLNVMKYISKRLEYYNK